LSNECNDILKENMIFTVEPGIYLNGVGGVRIEDDILIKKNGIELLTKTSRDFLEI
jgi:Xaa-Pro aminopeptidase